MKTLLKTLIHFLICLLLFACSTQVVKKTASEAKTEIAPANPANKIEMFGLEPPMSIMKDNRKLDRVRVMDGGACKNNLEGVKGTFLIYADMNDINRIKHEQGTKVFTEFENKIISFSSEILQKVINNSNLAKDPFALDEEEGREKLATRFTRDFDVAIAPAVSNFQKETGLTLDVKAVTPNLVFYQQGCSAQIMENEAPPKR